MSKIILYLMAYLHILGGVLLPFFVQFEWASRLIRDSLSNTPAQQGAVFWVGVFGPTIASWGVLFLCLLNIYFAQVSVRVWRHLIVAVLLWGVVDTSYCLLSGVPQALLSNIPAIIFLLLPLWLVRAQRLTGISQ